MTESSQQERSQAHYRSQARVCAVCRGEYEGGSYAEHKEGERHEMFLRARDHMDGIRAFPEDVFSAEFVSEMLGEESKAMTGTELLALLSQPADD